MKKRFLVFSLLALFLIVTVSAQESTSTTMASEIKEQVKCIFANANTEQKCYTDDGIFSCSGTGACIADVFGEKGKKLLWKSACEGTPTTIIDGDNKYAEFKCPEEFNKKIIVEQVKEQVTCIFANSDNEEKCYSDDGLFSCSGIKQCTADVYGDKERKLAWKSSCGGYAYSVIDGNNGYAEFKCVQESEVSVEEIKGKGFRFAYWQCYSGKEQKQGTESSCESSETWQKYAKEFCQDQCSDESKKCGVNSFSVAEECYTNSQPQYIDSTYKEMVIPPTIASEDKKEEIKEEKTLEKKEEIKKEEPLICKDSCPLEGKCYPFGYRNKGTYCSAIGSFVGQLEEESACENNFECSSNLCIDSSCVSSSLIQKVLSWLKNIFG